jgi:hypothetical protein
MAKWIDDLGDFLVKNHPNDFKLTPERHWQVKSENQWITLPDHYVLGIIMAIIGGVKVKESESDLNKLFYGAMTVAGIYLVLDDFNDFKKDIEQFLKEIKLI